MFTVQRTAFNSRANQQISSCLMITACGQQALDTENKKLFYHTVTNNHKHQKMKLLHSFLLYISREKKRKITLKMVRPKRLEIWYKIHKNKKTMSCMLCRSVVSEIQKLCSKIILKMYVFNHENMRYTVNVQCCFIHF